MVKQKINFAYWDKLKAKPDEHDAAAIRDAFNSSCFSESQKVDLAELILASRIRIMDEDRMDQLNDAIGKFEQQFAVEEFFYTESAFLVNTWRYSYREYAEAIPFAWAKKAIEQIYSRLGVELDDEEVLKVYNSDNIYSAFLELLSETLGNNLYIKADDVEHWSSFVFVSYFNLWHFFGVLGFNGYSPYTIIADIGILTPPASSWKYVALTEEHLYTIDELKSRSRGRSFPTWQQNRFLGILVGM